MLKRRLRWATMNGAMLSTGYFGLFRGVESALDVFLFLAWFTVVSALLCGLVEKAKLEARAKGRSVPWWLSTGCDLAVIISLASVGRFVLAAAMVLQLSIEWNVMDGTD